MIALLQSDCWLIFGLYPSHLLQLIRFWGYRRFDRLPSSFWFLLQWPECQSFSWNHGRLAELWWAIQAGTVGLMGAALTSSRSAPPAAFSWEGVAPDWTQSTFIGWPLLIASSNSNCREQAPNTRRRHRHECIYAPLGCRWESQVAALGSWEAVVWEWLN